MRRRDFIALMGAGATAWPLAARAQQATVPVVGVLMWPEASDPFYRTRVEAFLSRMRELGWNDGRNARFDVRWASRDSSRLMDEARQLVGLQPSVIIAGNTEATQALQKQTSTIPIIFGGAADPLASGIVTSISHPGGNVTGFTNYESSMGAKWLGLLKETAPSVNRILVVMQMNNDGNRVLMRAIETAAHSVSVQLSAIDGNDLAAIERGLPAFASKPNGGMVILPMVLSDAIIGLATEHKIPAIFPYRDWAVRGGLMSYGNNDADIFRGVANYADRIIRGEKPGDLPVQSPTKFELVINQKTAQLLGLTFPQSLLATADEVIE